MKSKFVRMWAEENHNNYDLLPIVRNYGPGMIFGICAKEAVAYAKDFHAEFYLKEDELKDFAEKGYDFYVRNDGFKRLAEKTGKNIIAVQEAMKRLVATNLQNLNGGELFQAYLQYVRPYGDLMACYITTQPQFIAKIEDELRAKLAGLPDSEEVFSILTGPDVDFGFSNKGGFFEKSFSELIGSENAEVDKTILDAPLYEEKPLDRSGKESAIQKYAPPEDAVHMAQILADIGALRLRMRFVWMPAIYLLELFLTELKRRYGLPKSVIRRYDSDEFDELLMAGQKVDEAVLSERSKGFAKVLRNGDVLTLVGDEAGKFIEEINKIDEEIREIRGAVASRGFARGRVVIFSYTKSSDHSEKIRGMAEGDILVSEMTRPSIIMACQKAGAIITDEGGITCHAAIVSRELKKPCIIGTKIATQALKDGDLVEVDADKGVVRIVKKA